MDEKLSSFHCPRWSELPGIPLYLDQLVMVLQDAIGDIFVENEPVVTKTMINNYVKQKLITPPEQKKYNRSHIMRLIVISLFKRVFSMNEIRLMIDYMIEEYGTEAAYNLFCSRFEYYLDLIFCSQDSDFAPQQNEHEEELRLDTAISALVCKLHLQYFLRERSPEEPKK